ncbi:hypothetical protein [Helicobacter cinaedi]|uniref:hypothetical protein n=1 Tax=Helicobacter cinaedi TaxID=213 RepID=UPI0015F25B30|nr:hypothetical protein [Helicobacter cinaedi]
MSLSNPNLVAMLQKKKNALLINNGDIIICIRQIESLLLTPCGAWCKWSCKYRILRI